MKSRVLGPKEVKKSKRIHFTFTLIPKKKGELSYTIKVAPSIDLISIISSCRASDKVQRIPVSREEHFLGSLKGSMIRRFKESLEQKGFFNQDLFDLIDEAIESKLIIAIKERWARVNRSTPKKKVR